jgi:hypothetical protein
MSNILPNIFKNILIVRNSKPYNILLSDYLLEDACSYWGLYLCNSFNLDDYDRLFHGVNQGNNALDRISISYFNYLTSEE